MALTGSEQAAVATGSLLGSWSQLKARLLDAEHLLVQRLAGTVFLIRVVSAALAFGSQVLFARWMGTFEFGIYVYVWTWVLLLGQAIDLGLGTAAQRFIPEYRERRLLALLRGFVTGSRWLAVAIAIGIAALGAGCVRLIQPWLDAYMVIPLYLACVTLPAYALANVQDGISRSYDWVGLAMMPAYVVRQLLLTVLMAAAYFARAADGCGDRDDRRRASRSGCRRSGQLLIVNHRLSDAHRARAEGLRFQDLARDRAADPDGRRLLLPAGLYRRAGAAAFPLAGRGRGLLRRRQDAGAGLVHLLLGRRRRPRTVSAAITSPATAKACRLSSRSRSNGRSGRRSRRPRCCCCSAGRS